MKMMIEDMVTQYETMLSLPDEKREDFFRHTMMKPLEEMGRTIHVPMKAKEPGGYDVVMATQMMGYLNVQHTDAAIKALKDLQEIKALDMAKKSLTDCIAFSEVSGLAIKADNLHFGMYIADPVKLEKENGYCGFGGIPGYVTIAIYPNDYNKPRIPSLIAHEFHHNLRFSYFDWDYGDVTVGDYIIIEGLAESFATAMYERTVFRSMVLFKF
ncbi:DUF2268 domain-containing putative Zn-dependent protease [Paenibacillus faecalis]|uniref:DUF2268 domain-containing putative Zn-dependent protease n=1 Tax=Paenibacillus faecalis TaxID=2079532 RepID=UPI0018F8804F|nr:DUF2268 domain-containing putative Zn-dependent protease [Paenibacillus faecalis]